MDLDPSPAPRLLIETGSHRDAASAIPLGETRVGAAFEAEIGVSDLDAPIAFALRRSTTALTVEARDAPLRLAGKTIRPGQSRTCTELRHTLDQHKRLLSRGVWVVRPHSLPEDSPEYFRGYQGSGNCFLFRSELHSIL